MDLIKKYKTLPVTVKASLWFLIAGILQKGIGILTTPIFTRLMSTAEYGKVSIYNSWSGIITIFATLNLSSGVFMKGLIKFKEDRKSFELSMQGLTTTIILICIIIYLLFYRFWNSIFDLSSILMISMFVNMLFLSAFQFWSGTQRIDFQYEKLIRLIVFNTTVTPIVSVIAVINSNNKVEARILSIVIVNIISFGFLYINQIKNKQYFFNKKYWKYALAFNLPLVPHYLSQVLLNQSDRIMINSIIGFEEAGIYSVAYSLSMLMLIINNSVLSTLSPWIYRKIDDKKFEDIASVSYMILVIIAMANLILIALAPEAISIMAPASYYKAIWVIPPVASSVFFMFMYSLFAAFEFYYEKTKFIMFASIGGAIVNIFLNYIFINKFGFIAAGYTTLICYIIYVSAHYYFMRKINETYMGGVKVFNEKIIIAISMIFLVLSTIFMTLYSKPLLRYGLLGIGIILIIKNIKKIMAIFKKIKDEK